MKAVENRAFAARLTMGDLCKIAGVSHSTWSRAKTRGTIRARTLQKIEEALDYYEAAAKRKAAQPADQEVAANG